MLVNLSVVDLVNQLDSLVYAPWTGLPISVLNVKEYSQRGNGEDFSYSETPYNYQETLDHDWHERRIAFLVSHRSVHPIDVEIYNGVVLHDGNHRLLAAYVRGDEWILSQVFGHIDYLDCYVSVQQIDNLFCNQI